MEWKRIYNWFKKPNNSLPLALVIVTSIYVIYTANMASTMEKQFNLAYLQFQQNNRPFLSLEYALKKDTAGKIKGYIFNIKNSGNLPAKYNISKFIISKDELDSIVSANFPEYYISPGVVRDITIPFSEEDQIKLINSGEFIDIILRIDYWSATDEYKKISYYYEENFTFDPTINQFDSLCTTAN